MPARWDTLRGERRPPASDKQVARREVPATLRIMMARLSGKQQLRGWFAHPYAAGMLPEDNCITEVVPG